MSSVADLFKNISLRENVQPVATIGNDNMEKDTEIHHDGDDDNDDDRNDNEDSTTNTHKTKKTKIKEEKKPRREESQRERMLKGELYYSFTPGLLAARARSSAACEEFNKTAGNTNISRYERVVLMNKIFGLPPPPPPPDPSSTDLGLLSYPWIEPPIRVDYGTNTYISHSTYINFSCTILDTCSVTIGPRCLIGPNVSFYTATHPIDPRIRNGIEGPEFGKPIVVEEDVWIGGGVMILPGVRIKRGAVVGAGSVVTRDVEEFTVVGGNPARLLKKIDVSEKVKVKTPETRTEEEIERERKELKQLQDSGLL